MWSLLGVLVALGFVIVLIRMHKNFGLSLLVGAFVLGLFGVLDGNLSLLEVGKAYIEGTCYSFESGWYADTILLAILMTLIFMLATCMQRLGAVGRLVNSMQTVFVHGGMLGVVPAVYGLMPVPGGAMFSAPLVDEEGKRFGLRQSEKNFLNVWFRHIWFSIYPISSAMILICSASFSNIDIALLMAVNVPAFVTALVVGMLYLRFVLRKHPKPKKSQNRDWSGFVFLLPPLIPIVVYAVLSFWSVAQVPSFIVGVLCSFVALFVLLKIPLKQFASALKKSITWKLVAAIFGIMVFRQMFEATGASSLLAEVLTTQSLSPLFIIVGLPILLGVLTGYNLGAMTLSYPLVEPFFSSSGLGIVGATSLVFMSSVAGYLISPIHLCNVVSSEYLKTDTTRMYKNYIPAVAVMLGVQIVWLMFGGF